MASQQLGPIFPPDGLNYSPEALEAAQAVLGDETRAILAADRARLAQTTALGVHTLAATIGLSETSTRELQTSLGDRLGNMPPSYHGYVNQLLGAAATALMNQVTTEQTPHSSGIMQPNGNGHKPGTALPLTTASQEVLSVGSAEETEAAPILGVATPSEPEEQSDELESEVLQYNLDDILTLPEGVRLYDHPKIPRNMKNFLSDILVSHTDIIGGLEPRAATLLAYEIVELLRRTRISYSKLDSGVQAERVAGYVGLFGPSLTTQDLGARLNVSGGALAHSIRRVVDALRGHIEDNLLEKAVATAAYGPVDEIFTKHSNYDSLLLGSEVEGTVQDPEQDNSGMPPEGQDNSGTTPMDASQESRAFYEHHKVPANMRNFLLGVFPAEYGDRILGLRKRPASLLTHQLIEAFRAVPTSAGREEAMAQFCEIVEQWTGLYSEPQDESALADRKAVSPVAIKNKLAAVISTLEKRIDRKQLREIYDNATTVSDPRRPIAPTAPN